MKQLPILSIVIPTHNRSDILRKSLLALSRQSWPVTKFEVLVVADACYDDTVETVTAYARQTPYTLRLLSHSARSASATRNLGATNARGSILLFLDDDVVAQPKLVQAHVEAQHQDGIVFGYSKPALPEKPSWWQYDARRWWEDTFRAMRQPGHRFSYRDFFSGNVSLPAVLFHKVGGFDTSLTGRLEDYELGLRLLKMGCRFRYVHEAVGYHYDNTDLERWLRRIRQEGVADIHIGQRHPEVRTSLFIDFTESYDWRKWLIRKIAFAYPQVGDWLERQLFHQAVLCERLRIRNLWRKVVGVLREYNYWRGVVAAIGGRQEMLSWLQEASMPPAVADNAPVIEMTVLPPGDMLQRILEKATNVGLRLALNGVEVLAMPPQPGAEPLRKEHLYNALQELAEQDFIPALAFHLVHSTIEGGSLYAD